MLVVPELRVFAIIKSKSTIVCRYIWIPFFNEVISSPLWCLVLSTFVQLLADLTFFIIRATTVQSSWLTIIAIEWFELPVRLIDTREGISSSDLYVVQCGSVNLKAQ